LFPYPSIYFIYPFP